MPSPTKADWKAWNAERRRFLDDDTQGFRNNIEALEAHIAVLLEVAPKDSAGYPHRDARQVIATLRTNLDLAKTWLGRMS